MVSRTRFDVSDLTSAAQMMSDAADNVETNLEEEFHTWVGDVHDAMQEEAPALTGELRESIETTFVGEGLHARVRPTKMVRGAGGKEHNLAFLLEHGVGDRPPNAFMMRTYERARDMATRFKVEGVL